MNILGSSTIDINCFKSALLINKDNVEYMCSGIGFSLDTHEVMLDLKDLDGIFYASVPFGSIKDWSIQFNTTHLY